MGVFVICGSSLMPNIILIQNQLRTFSGIFKKSKQDHCYDPQTDITYHSHHVVYDEYVFLYPWLVLSPPSSSVKEPSASLIPMVAWLNAPFIIASQSNSPPYSTCLTPLNSHASHDISLSSSMPSNSNEVWIAHVGFSYSQNNSFSFPHGVLPHQEPTMPSISPIPAAPLHQHAMQFRSCNNILKPWKFNDFYVAFKHPPTPLMSLRLASKLYNFRSGRMQWIMSIVLSYKITRQLWLNLILGTMWLM